MRSKIVSIFISPATPSAILLYGIIFGFAMWSYLGWSWQRSDTIILYLATSIWATAIIFYRSRVIGFSLNRLDVIFSLFLLLVLASIAAHWWAGTAMYLEYMPVFFVLPFLLGRMMGVEDVLLFRKILIGMGSALLMLMPVEYWKNSRPDSIFGNSPIPILFGQGHGGMLSGLMLSATFLFLLSILIAQAKATASMGRGERWSRLIRWIALALVVFEMVWISSRGALIAALVGMIILFLFFPFCGWRRKAGILFYVSLMMLIAFTDSFQNEGYPGRYREMIQPPTVMLDVVEKAGVDLAWKLEHGKPILGAKSCELVVDSIAARWIYYQEALAIFSLKPLVGVGVNWFGFYSCVGPGGYPHSTILQVFAEIGVLGGLLYLTLLWMGIGAIVTRNISSGEMYFRMNGGWLLAFFILQFVASQFNGNYLASAGLYFVVGLSSSFVGAGGKILRGASLRAF